MTPEQFQKLDEVYTFMQNMKSFDSIPVEVDKALRRRLLSSIAQLAVSTKGLDTEDQAVDEGGAATYSVLGDPDGFLEIAINGTIRYLPYY